jgi:cell division septation protein DedD
LAQDDYYYEIQLTNKQLVFYFMAGATGLILSFLAGVMVGRGVDAGSEVQAARSLVEERVVTEEPARPAPQPAVEELTYSQRLESERVDESLEKPAPAREDEPAAAAAAAQPKPSSAPVASRAGAAGPPASKPAPARTVQPRAGTPKPGAASKAVAKVSAPSAGSFSIQVGAFKDRASADSMVSRLKEKGYAAFAVSPAGADGLFNVRVGTFEARADAERIQRRLTDEEKFKPFIVKN